MDKQQLEATLKLLRTSGDFVEPRYVSGRVDDGRVSVAFMFKGPEDPQRRIKLTVWLADSERNTLGMLVRQCRDQRIVAKMVSDQPKRESPAEGRHLLFPALTRQSTSLGWPPNGVHRTNPAGSRRRSLDRSSVDGRP